MTAAPRPVWIGTSWKMNKTLAEASQFVETLVAEPVPPGVQVFFLPAHTALATVRSVLPRSFPALLGAQNAHWSHEGAGTGEVSMRMVADAGADLIEIGHSERRADFGETDRTVALKVRAALDAGLLPLICLGEPHEVRERGDQEAFVMAQARAALSKVLADEVAEVALAYEPVWAIGTGGRPATVSEVAGPMRALADTLAALSSGRGARALLYGGGVDQNNADALLGLEHSDGLFVGRAAWDAVGFRQLIEMAGRRAAFAR